MTRKREGKRERQRREDEETRETGKREQDDKGRGLEMSEE